MPEAPKSTADSTPLPRTPPGPTPTTKGVGPMSREEFERVVNEAADRAFRRMDALLRSRVTNQKTSAPVPSSDFDPTILADAAELAAIYFEAGIKRFAAFARQMVQDGGATMRPYLASAYLGARQMPGVDRTGTDSAGYVESLTEADIDSFLRGLEEPRQHPQSRADAEPDPGPARVDADVDDDAELGDLFPKGDEAPPEKGEAGRPRQPERAAWQNEPQMPKWTTKQPSRDAVSLEAGMGFGVAVEFLIRNRSLLVKLLRSPEKLLTELREAELRWREADYHAVNGGATDDQAMELANDAVCEGLKLCLPWHEAEEEESTQASEKQIDQLHSVIENAPKTWPM